MSLLRFGAGVEMQKHVPGTFTLQQSGTLQLPVCVTLTLYLLFFSCAAPGLQDWN